MPIIERLELEDFGCFPRLSVKLGAFNVIVGANDSGKTTLLRALMATGRLAPREGGDRQSLASELGMPKILWARSVTGTTRIRVSGELGERGSYFVDTTMRPRSAYEDIEEQTIDLGGLRVTAKEQQIESPSSWADAWAKFGSPRMEGASLLNAVFDARSVEYSLWSAARDALRRDLRDISIYRLDPNRLRSPSGAPQGEDAPSLGSDGAGLATTLAVLSTGYLEARRRIDDAFRLAVPTLAGFKILPMPADILPGGWRLVFSLRNGAGDIEADQVSDGALLFLAFLTLLNHPHPPRAILMEEPENGVHPGRLADIVKLLRKLTKADDTRPGVQIVMTTHSPYLLDEVQSDEALACYRDEEGAAHVVPFSEVPGIDELLAESRLGEIWGARGEEPVRRIARQSPRP